MGQTEHSNMEYKVYGVKVTYLDKNNKVCSSCRTGGSYGLRADEIIRGGRWPRRRGEPGKPTSEGGQTQWRGDPNILIYPGLTNRGHSKDS